MKFVLTTIFVVLLTLITLPAQENNVSLLNLDRTDAIKWAKEHGLTIDRTFSDGRQISLIGVVNGVPQYLTTFEKQNRTIDTTNFHKKEIELKNWAAKNKIVVDSLFEDGSRLTLKEVKDNKPIYIYSNFN